MVGRNQIYYKGLRALPPTVFDHLKNDSLFLKSLKITIKKLAIKKLINK